MLIKSRIWDTQNGSAFAYIVCRRLVINRIQVFLTFYLLCLVPILGHSESRFQVDFGGDFFTSTAEHRFSSGIANAKLHLQDENYKLDIGVGANFNKSISEYYYAKEAYYKLKMSSHLFATEWTLGRRVIGWSHLDEFWKLGITEPLWRWNPSQPELQGLSGSFLELNGARDKLVLFVSPLYIPSQSPSFNRYDGRLISSNPWFDPPFEFVQVNGEVIPLNYNIFYPQIGDVILQLSFGVKWENKFDENNLLRFSYLNKPKNDLVLLVDGVITTEPVAIIEVHPEVARHQTVGFDWSHKINSNWTINGSALYEFTTNFTAPTNLTYPIFRDNTLIQIDVENKYDNESSYGFGGLYTPSVSTETLGALSSSQSNLFAYRYHYTQAAKVYWNQFWGSCGQLQSQANATYSFATQTVFLSLKLDYKVDQNWSLFALTEVFGGSGDRPQVSDFIARYINHDHGYFGVRYVF